MKKIGEVISLLIITSFCIFSVSGCTSPFYSEGRKVLRIALDKNYIETGDSDVTYYSDQDVLYGMIMYSLDSEGEFNYLNNSDEDPEGIKFSFSKKEAKQFFDLIESFGLDQYEPFSLSEKNELITEYKSKTICIGDEIVIKDEIEYKNDQFNYLYYTSDNYDKIIEEFDKLKNKAK